MREFTRARIRSFRYAFEGWWHVLRTQRNAWIHASFSVGAVLLGLWLRLESRDWAIIILAVAIVWMAEFLNTALEAIVDLASPEHNSLAKIGKDVGAAAVLIAAGTAVLIGLFIFGPPLWDKINSLPAP